MEGGVWREGYSKGGELKSMKCIAFASCMPLGFDSKKLGSLSLQDDPLHAAHPPDDSHPATHLTECGFSP